VGIAFQVTFDSADPAAHAAFWAEALHYVPQPPPDGFDSWDAAYEAEGASLEERTSWAALVDPDGVGPRLYFQRVPERKTAKNRVHLDLRSAAGAPEGQRNPTLERERERLEALGARLVNRLEPDGVNDLCLVMQDPEGNEFCLD
jgi:hypothetical protein